MPYAASKAKKALCVDLKTIKGRARLSRGKKIPHEIREYTIAASIFLTHAALENYISDLFDSFAAAVQSTPCKGSDLPENLRSHLFLNKIDKGKIYGAALGLNGEHESLIALNKSLNGYAGTIIDSAKQVFSFSGKDIFTQYKYPSETNLKRVFQRIGINKPFEEIDRRLKRDSIRMLTSLGDLRTQLAHTGQLPGISVEDVTGRIDEVETLSGGIDRMMYSYVSKLYTQRIWIEHMA